MEFEEIIEGVKKVMPKRDDFPESIYYQAGVIQCLNVVANTLYRDEDALKSDSWGYAQFLINKFSREYGF